MTNGETKIFDNQLMKELCANTLRSVLRQLRTASIEELSRVSGLEERAVTALVPELCFSGEFIEETIPGEEEQFFRFNGEHKLVLAICMLEKNRVVASVNDLYGEYLEKEEIAASPDNLDFFDNLVESYRAKYPDIGLLAFGMAGFEVRGSGRLLSINFPNLEVHFRDHFMEKYRLPSILENDIKAAVLGYYETRNFGEDECVAALYLPQTHHPAGAICMNGTIYRGRDNASGEAIYLDTDVQWKHFGSNDLDYSKVDMPKLIADMALPLVVYINPHCLVIYGSALTPDTGDTLHKRLLEVMPREFIPDIVFVPDILPDFLDGLIYLALKALEPKVDFAETAEV
ncbi:hypothetical protein AGMMS50230_19490 [Spirochaetia bacterium]|nr:hypothetical protein AGMMS50230_19490 [Spirochaetia bacterium]